MKMIHVHSDGTEYQVVRISPEEPRNMRYAGDFHAQPASLRIAMLRK
jgi:hypothetical protein